MVYLAQSLSGEVLKGFCYYVTLRGGVVFRRGEGKGLGICETCNI